MKKLHALPSTCSYVPILPVISYCFCRYVAHATFWLPMQSLSLLTAVDRDAEETQEAENITGDLPAMGARDA